MIKPGANQKDQAAIKNMADEGESVKKISAVLKIDSKCVESIVKAHKSSKKSK